MIILIVETCANHLKQYKDYLEDKGHQVTGVQNGAEAIMVIADQTKVFDAVITLYEVGITIKGLAVLDAINQSGRNVPTLLQHHEWDIRISLNKKQLQRFLTIEVQVFPFASFALKTEQSTHIDEFLANINCPAQSNT